VKNKRLPYLRFITPVFVTSSRNKCKYLVFNTNILSLGVPRWKNDIYFKNFRLALPPKKR